MDKYNENKKKECQCIEYKNMGVVDTCDCPLHSTDLLKVYKEESWYKELELHNKSCIEYFKHGNCIHYPANDENWEERFDKEFTKHNLRDDLSEQKVARYIKDFIRSELSREIITAKREVVEDILKMKYNHYDEYGDGWEVIAEKDVIKYRKEKNI